MKVCKKRNGHKPATGDREWILTPEDGAYALLIAVIEQARADAASTSHRSVDNYHRVHAIWFLTGLQEFLA